MRPRHKGPRSDLNLLFAFERGQQRLQFGIERALHDDVRARTVFIVYSRGIILSLRIGNEQSRQTNRDHRSERQRAVMIRIHCGEIPPGVLSQVAGSGATTGSAALSPNDRFGTAASGNAI